MFPRWLLCMEGRADFLSLVWFLSLLRQGEMRQVWLNLRSIDSLNYIITERGLLNSRAAVYSHPSFSGYLPIKPDIFQRFTPDGDLEHSIIQWELLKIPSWSRESRRWLQLLLLAFGRRSVKVSAKCATSLRSRIREGPFDCLRGPSSRGLRLDNRSAQNISIRLPDEAVQQAPMIES